MGREESSTLLQHGKDGTKIIGLRNLREDWPEQESSRP